ncbi:CTP synthase [Bienertia sinuspersici]
MSRVGKGCFCATMGRLLVERGIPMLLQSLHTTLVERWQINRRNDVEARCVIDEGFGAKVGCTMLNKNKNTFLFDDDN